jgi:hypothetical protein
MNTTHTPDLYLPVKRLQLDHASNTLVEAPKRDLFLRGPVPISWLNKAAELPGKTLNIAIALWWLHGMAKGKPFKLTQTALNYFHVKRDAASDGLERLEKSRLIQVERHAGRRPTITLLYKELNHKEI